MAQPGYVYVLVNPSANEFLKIGKTERDPEARAKELSSATGVPTPFYVAFQSYFQDCTRAEAFVHERLAKYRVANNREFFRVPLRQAIDAILEAERVLQRTDRQIVGLTDTDGDASLDEFEVSSDDPWQACYDEAENYYHGYGDTLQDLVEALRLYKQAARLGCKSAYWRIGAMYRDGEGCVVDTKTALNYFKEGVQNGDGRCWAEMASLFLLEGHIENCRKCWSRYFESAHFENNIVYSDRYFSRGYYGLKYIEQHLATGGEMPYREKLTAIREELIDNAYKASNPAALTEFFARYNMPFFTGNN